MRRRFIIVYTSILITSAVSLFSKTDLSSIYIPEVVFEDKSLKECLAEIIPFVENEGHNLGLVYSEIELSERRVTITLRNFPAEKVLRFIGKASKTEIILVGDSLHIFDSQGINEIHIKFNYGSETVINTTYNDSHVIEDIHQKVSSSFLAKEIFPTMMIEENNYEILVTVKTHFGDYCFALFDEGWRTNFAVDDFAADDFQDIIRSFIPLYPEIMREILRIGINVPETLEEATKQLIDTLPYRLLVELKNEKEENLMRFHMGLGMHVRNNFYLWSKNSPLLLEIAERQKEKEIHPDDASGIIIKMLWEELNKTEKKD